MAQRWRKGFCYVVKIDFTLSINLYKQGRLGTCVCSDVNGANQLNLDEWSESSTVGSSDATSEQSDEDQVHQIKRKE